MPYRDAKRRPPFTDPAEAWRVSSFVRPERLPGARITSHYQTAADVDRELKYAAGREDGIDACARVSPEGRYTALRVQVDYDNGERDWKCVMSDTPAEYADHADLIDHAHGRVLLHGLGLGCALSAILAKSEVEHVDVVEVNPHVIAAISPYYRGYPVMFHLGSCADERWPAGKRWDYVFHDIWTWITPKNLSDDTAEHGISYGRMFSMFDERAGRQGAWAHDLALALNDHQLAAAA